MKQAVRAPRAASPSAPAPPNRPAPAPACLPFWVSSALASSSSWWTSRVVCSESCLSSSPSDRSRRSSVSPGTCGGHHDLRSSRGSPSGSPCTVRVVGADPGRARRRGGGRRVGHLGGVGAGRAGLEGAGGGGAGVIGTGGVGPVVAPVAVALGAGLVAAAARRLHEPRGGEPEHEATGRDQHGLAAGEVLDVAQEPVAAGLLEVVAHPVGLICDLLGKVRRGILALVARLLGDRAHIGSGPGDTLAGLGRALVDLVAKPASGLPERPSRLVLGHLGLVADLVLDLVGGRPAVGGRPEARIGHVALLSMRRQPDASSKRFRLPLSDTGRTRLIGRRPAGASGDRRRRARGCRTWPARGRSCSRW